MGRYDRRSFSATPVVALGVDDFAWARRSIARIVRKHSHLRDDLEAEAMLALHLASLDYRPSGNRFRSYATLKIRGAVIDYLRAQNRSLRNVAHAKEPERLFVARFVVLADFEWDRLPAGDGDEPEELLDRRRRRAQLRRMITKLPERHAAMLTMHVLDDVPLRDVGTAFGVTESRASQVVNAAMQAIAGKEIRLRKIATRRYRR